MEVALFRRNRTVEAASASTLEPPAPRAPHHDVEASIAAGHADAIQVAHGDRVVRAILAHFAEETFAAMCPDLDLDRYLEAYRTTPGAKAPMDRRQQPATAGQAHPRRRWDDYYT